MNNKIVVTLMMGMLILTYVRCGYALELSEQDYFAELPTVLTVNRLAQPLNETPGAVTVLDRAAIRRSGARELADVLRLVPGYLVSGYNGANPGAAYHAPLDEFGSRNLVLVDGRPVYSAYYLGDTHRGMMGVLPEDIERVEVLRGSNSAAYGANAMFGVINIITRHTGDTQGALVSITGGTSGIADNTARIGWGSESASFRLSTGRLSDTGYKNANDNKIVSQLHFRGDLRPAIDQELMFTVGVSQLATGEGFDDKTGNPERTTNWRDYYLHGIWQRQLSQSDQIKLTANYDEESFRDNFIYGPDPSVKVDFGGRGRRLNLEFQHQVGLGERLRAVWGVGYKYEDAYSPPIYNRSGVVSIHENRLFGNLEWRPHQQWILNAGGFFGDHSRKGNYFSPRLMANFLATPDHTLRVGYTESSRMPTLFEMAADVRYYPQSLSPWPPTAKNILPLFAFLNIPYRTYAASGKVGPEKLFAQEIGYLGKFQDWRMTLDVRAYVEHVKDVIRGDPNATAPGYVFPVNFLPYFHAGDSIPVIDSVNGAGFKTHGIEYQWRFKPYENTEIWVNQNFQRLIWNDGGDVHMPPTHASTVALFQKLPMNLNLSLMFHALGAMTWNDQKDKLHARHRLDAHLAWPFLVGSSRVEASVTVQAANGSYLEYLPSRNFTFERRAFGSLRIEF